jgi:Raf kinase inhibitor-like YbhB/YbcL family protein
LYIISSVFEIQTLSGENMNSPLRLFASIALAGGMFTGVSVAQEQDFQLSSTAFSNDSFLPLSAINNNVVNNTNSCSINGLPGGNESPELSWTGAPAGTQSFVVTTYDVTAAFTHWGMYNIAASATGLPQNAGIAGSTFGSQIINDFFIGAEYDGPCPPANVAPFAHRYVFTVYALNVVLQLPSSANFPATAESLYQALIKAGQTRHILASATLTGLYSTTPTGN